MSNPIGHLNYRSNETTVTLVILFGWFLVMVPVFVFGHSSLTGPYVALLGFSYMFVVLGIAALRARARVKRVTACRSARGRVTEILDGSLVAAAQVDTDEAFVARFVVVAEDGSRIVVEPGPTQLIELAEIRVGDQIEIQGPHTRQGEGTYRGTEPTLVYRGTKATPLTLSRTDSSATDRALVR